MKTNEKSKEELNYKQAYHYLFNKVTDTIKALKIIQRKAEDICIDETISDNTAIDTDEMLKELINNIKEGDMP